MCTHMAKKLGLFWYLEFPIWINSILFLKKKSIQRKIRRMDKIILVFRITKLLSFKNLLTNCIFEYIELKYLPSLQRKKEKSHNSVIRRKCHSIICHLWLKNTFKGK